MNPDPQTTDSQPAMAPDPAPSIPSPNRRRRTGKVASLPKSVRDQINLLLQDGLPYRAILEKLQAPDATPLPFPITEHNLSEWKDGGYQDWLDDQFWQREMRARQEAFLSLPQDLDALQLPEGGLQLAATGICEILRDLSRRSTDDPAQFLRAANSLARLSRSILQLQQYRDACARARTALQPLKDPNRQLTQDERRAIVRQVDKILGLNLDGDTNVPGQDGLISCLHQTAPQTAPK